MGSGSSTSLTISHHWTLDNFSYLYDANCQWKWSVESEWFSPADNENLKFSLEILPKEKGKNSEEEYLKVGLTTQEIPSMWEGQVTVEWRWCIVNGKGKKLLCKEYAKYEVFKDVWAFAEYLPVEKLLNSSAGYLKGGTLRVLCEMTLHSPEAIFTSAGNTHLFSSMTIPFSVSSLSHSFTLSHFKRLCEDSTRQMPLKVESKYFAPQRENIGKVKLEFYPKGDKGNDEEKVKIAICNENTDSLNVHVECFLLDAEGVKDDRYHQIESTNLFPPNIGGFHSVPRHRLLSLLDSLPTDELTINCQVTVWGKGEQNKAPSHTTPTTTNHVDLAFFTFHNVSFTWTIERFQLHRQYIDSKVFFPSSDSRYSFYLRLYPNTGKENVTLALAFVSTSYIEESTVDWRYSVVDRKGKEWKGGVYTHSLSKPAQFGPHDLIPHRTLRTFASHLFPKSKLTIKCELWIHEPRKELPPELLSPQANDAIASLSAGFTQVNISHFNLSNSILASQSTITAGNINNAADSTTDESSELK